MLRNFERQRSSRIVPAYDKSPNVRPAFFSRALVHEPAKLQIAMYP